MSYIILRNVLFVLLFYMCKSVWSYPFQPSIPTGFSLNPSQISDTSSDAHSLIYPLARLPLELQQLSELASAASENVEQQAKVLMAPLAFSYTNETEDLKQAATHIEDKNSASIKPSKHESGGGKSNFSEHKSTGGEKGVKGHKGFHDHELAKKGHYDKEAHKGSYSDKGGKKEEHYKENDYSGEAHAGKVGKKAGKFEESGKHDKGHNTKGGHSISKTDHYEKKHEFFDEFYEDGHSEKEGGFHHEKNYHKGGKKKGSHLKGGHETGGYGKKGHNEKGHHYAENKGHKEEAGHEAHHAHEDKYGKKGDKKGGKKWGYKDGNGGSGGKKKSNKSDNYESGSSNLENKRIVRADDQSDIANKSSSEYEVYETPNTKPSSQDSDTLETLESLLKSMEVEKYFLNNPKFVSEPTASLISSNTTDVAKNTSLNDSEQNGTFVDSVQMSTNPSHKNESEIMFVKSSNDKLINSCADHKNCTYIYNNDEQNLKPASLENESKYSELETLDEDIIEE